MEKYIGANKWRWIQLKTNEMNGVQTVNEQDHNIKDWLKHVRKSKNNYLQKVKRMIHFSNKDHDNTTSEKK